MEYNRILCDVLDEMRACCKTLHFGPLPGLIEEVQILGNRMEAGLHDKNQSNILYDSICALKREIKALEKKKEGLQNEDETRSE